MGDAIRSAVAQAAETFAAYVGTLPPAAISWWWSSSAAAAAAPTDCDIDEIHAKARWLIRMLEWVRATVDDVEDMDVADECICNWLRELQAVADDAEDVLDEFPYWALRLRLMGDGSWTVESITATDKDVMEVSPSEASPRQAGEMAMHRQVRCAGSPTPSHEVFSFLCSVEQRIEEIVSRFMKIEKPEQALQLEYSKGQMQAEAMRRATSPVTERQRILGRDEDLATVKQFLLPSDAEESSGGDDMDDVPVMAIVGMGGLGKTTLAQLAYNDDQVNRHFQLKSWVCVPEDFDVVRVTKEILRSLNVEDNGCSELDPLHKKLQRRLGGKESLLLVLDDVWEAENFNLHSYNLLTAPLRNRSADTKIILTTRSQKVSGIVAWTSTHKLSVLSDEDSLELFKQHAFQGRDLILYPKMVSIGEEIARKCRGVPLVIKTLGGLLRTKDDEEEWSNILESNVWDATIQENSIIPTLRLSYQHLPASLKRCFRYCSLFPKDHSLDRDQIIRLWMAHGYIRANRKELMEDVGQRHINDLLSMSFFEEYSSHSHLRMHDLMHDLARCVSQDECYSKNGDDSCLNPNHLRHFSVLPTSFDPRGSIILSSDGISEPKAFRSFLYTKLPASFSISDGELPHSVYTKMEHLRVLHLGDVTFYDLPESIALLKHLRYLCINSYLRKLPEFVGTLYHLQTLDLQKVCALSELPNSISNLVNLRHLIGTISCVEYPVGIGKLTNLHTMSVFPVSSRDNCAKLGELKDMNNIRGSLIIEDLQNLDDVNEAKKAHLDKKSNISSLDLRWAHGATSSPIDDEVLESLKPSLKLGNLCIWHFKGPSYPSWLGDPSFSRLSDIALLDCHNWTLLPPFGQLPLLKSLTISRARGVEYIRSEFFCGGFPELETLHLNEMDNWKSWCGAQEGQCPKLENLCVSSCPNLESLSLTNLNSAKEIAICWCPKLQCTSGNSLQLSHLLSVQKIEIRYIYQVGRISADFCCSPSLECLPHLKLDDVGQREAECMLGMCSHICQLSVKRCSNLTSLPLGNPSALQYVKISECPELKITSVSPQLWQLPSLQGIYVNGVRGAEFIRGLFSHGGHCQKKYLFSRGGREALETAFLELTNVDQLVASSFFLSKILHTIRRLMITRCANLTCLPWTELTTLEYLTISECPLFQLLDAEQLPPTLQVLCIYGNPCDTEPCSQHQHSQRLKKVHKSNKEGGEGNTYIVFRNVQNASEASDFCSKLYTKLQIHTLEIEWDCCTNFRSNVMDSIAEEVLGKLYRSQDGIRSLNKLVIRGYTGSRFASPLWDPSLHSLSSVTLQQCSKCEILPPLGQLRSLEELYVEGASSLENIIVEEYLLKDDDMSEEERQETQTHVAFPRLKKLEFHDMPVWKEWSGAKEGDFPLLRKLILKRCPKLRALPYLPPKLKELELEACHELRSLSSFGSHHTQGLKFVKYFSRLSLMNFLKRDLSATEGLPLTLQHMSLTNCLLLLTWCEEHSATLVHIPNMSIDGVQVSTKRRKGSIGYGSSFFLSFVLFSSLP